jgi:hypothetical protein
MDRLEIEATNSTPKIFFDKESGKFEISGKSFPEECRVFYSPVYVWLEEYAQNPNEETIFKFKMEYFNSASSLIILEILNILETIKKNGKKVTILWNHLSIDEDMLEAGEEYSDLVSLNFEYNTIEDFN